MTFERVVVVHNPVSTNARRTEPYIAQIRQHFAGAEVTVMATVPGGLAANEAILQKHAGALGPHTLLVIIAGDGTINMMVTILLQSPGFSDAARQTVVLPLWGGNANDLAHMLGGRARRSITNVLRAAKPIAVRPLECRLETSDGNTQTRLAVSYASFGASAAAARRLGQKIRSDHPAHVVPGVRFAQEIGSANRAVRQSAVFNILREGNVETAFEYVFLNGWRMGKITGRALRLADEHFHGVIVPTWSSSLVLHVIRMRNRRRMQHFAHQIIAFIVGNDIWAQFDGETVEVTAGTGVTVALSKTPLTLLATKR